MCGRTEDARYSYAVGWLLIVWGCVPGHECMQRICTLKGLQATLYKGYSGFERNKLSPTYGECGA